MFILSDLKLIVSQGDALYKIFLSTIEVINQLQTSPVSQHRREWLQLMTILHSILSWDFGVILCEGCPIIDKLLDACSLNLISSSCVCYNLF